MNLKKSRKILKNATFYKCVKSPPKANFNCLMFFKSDRPACNHLDVNFIKTTFKTIFSLKKSIFAFLTQKALK